MQAHVVRPTCDLLRNVRTIQRQLCTAPTKVFAVYITIRDCALQSGPRAQIWTLPMDDLKVEWSTSERRKHRALLTAMASDEPEMIAAMTPPGCLRYPSLNFVNRGFFECGISEGRGKSCSTYFAKNFKVALS
jgi:hypothetical protein